MASIMVRAENESRDSISVHGLSGNDKVWRMAKDKYIMANVEDKEIRTGYLLIGNIRIDLYSVNLKEEA
jgi:hypothetical protein